MIFSCISPDEVRAKYNAAQDKGYILGILADLTASTRSEVKAFLGITSVVERKRKRKTPVVLNRTEAKRLYDQGLGDIQIADMLGVTKSTVGTWRRKNGLATNTPNEVADNRMELYRQGLNDSEIAEAVGASKKTIYSWRHAHALPPNGTCGGDRRSKEYKAGKKTRCGDADHHD